MKRKQSPRVFTITQQLFLLLAVAIVLSQAFTVLAVTLLPPAQPPIRTIGEVADELRGLAQSDEEKPSFTTRSADALPERFSIVQQGFEQQWREQLAVELDTSLANVRVHIEKPTLLKQIAAGQPVASRPDALGRFGRSRPGFAPGFERRDPAMGSGPPFLSAGLEEYSASRFPMAMRPFPPRNPPPVIVGNFSAAWRQPDGTWTISSTPTQLSGVYRMLFWFVGGMVVVSPFVFWFANRLAAPVRKFAEAADELGRNPGGPSLDIKGPAEIGLAADAFNKMQQRLKRYVNDRVNAISTISHDLRMPLTRLRFRAEAVDPKLRAGLLSDVEQMEQMVTDVLAFMRSANQPARREELDLVELVGALSEMADISVPFQIASRDRILVEGDGRSLERLFLNLIDNGAKHGGGEVSIGLEQVGENAVVTISDAGPGIPADELEQVFEPFYRTSSSKDRVAGAGLGLTSARAIARAHGGDIVLSSGEGGLRAAVSLPIIASGSTSRQAIAVEA